MAFVYPSAIDTPGGTVAQGGSLLTTPDHAQDHRVLGSAVIGIETFLGTNAANAGVFSGYTAGQVPVAINTGTLGTTIAKGTINNSVIGTALITGGTLQTGVVSNDTIAGGTIISGIQNNGSLTGGTYVTPTFAVWNGWVQANETGTMLGTLSANGIITGTLQVAATASNKYDKGDKVNFTQGGTNMYGYVYSIPTGTTLLITGGTDYQYGTTAVTNLLYGKVETPNGFPGTFNYNPNETWTGTAPTGNTKRVAQFSMRGNMVYLRFYSSYGTGGSSTQMTINQPIPSLESSSIFHDWMIGGLGTQDNTAFNAGISGGLVIMFSNTIIQNGPVGAVLNRSAYINGFYAV